MAKKSSKTSELYAAAQMRLQDFLVASVGDDGNALPAEMRDNITTVINSDRKTYRYMLFVGLLVSVTDQRLHPRCLQQKASCNGAFNARSLCAEVVVPFEKSTLKGRLGGSCDPYVSNPARLPMVEKNNDAKSSLDRDHLSRLYDVLEYAKNSNLPERKKLFRYAFSCVLARPAEESSLVEFGTFDKSSLGSGPFFDFLEAHTQGASAVAVLTAFFKLFYEKGTRVVAHPLTESGASPKEVGDIDLEFKDGRAYAVEVKAKAFSEIEVNHACEKAYRAGIHRVIFAFGPDAEKGRWHEGALVNLWSEKGVELTFLSIEGALAVAMAASDACIRVRMAEEIALALNEINASDGVKSMFRTMFSREQTRE